jgi:hypothetical protein
LFGLRGTVPLPSKAFNFDQSTGGGTGGLGAGPGFGIGLLPGIRLNAQAFSAFCQAAISIAHLSKSILYCSCGVIIYP